jgi:hypothetical protein
MVPAATRSPAKYVVNLDAPEDLHGKGHLSHGLGQFRHSLMIPID